MGRKYLDGVMESDGLYVYLVIRKRDAFFMSVHLTPKDAKEACDRMISPCQVMEVNVAHACEYFYDPEEE